MAFDDAKLTIEDMVEQTKLLISDAKYIYAEQSIFSEELENWSFCGYSSEKVFLKEYHNLFLSNAEPYAKIHIDKAGNIWLDVWKKSIKINPKTLKIVNFSTKCKHRAYKNPDKFDCLYSMPKDGE